MLPRVLQIGKHFYPDRGGIETVTKNISEALVEHGITADVLCMALNSQGDRQEHGYRVIRSPSSFTIAGNKTFSWRYLQHVRALSSEYDVGILHVPNPLGAAAVLAFWKRPLIVLWHADFHHPVLNLITGPLDVALARRADVVIAPTSLHLSASNRAQHLTGKGETIPFPFPSLSSPAATRTTLIDTVVRAARGRPIVLAAGRLVSYKGFNILIEAMRHVRTDLFCVIVGDGPLRGTLEQQIRDEGVSSSAMLAGSASDAEMSTLLGLAHFGCLPSVTPQEMYGLTQVEMMAAGKPMVSTNLPCSGVPLVNRDGVTGLLVEPGNAKDLAAKLTRLVSDADLYSRLSRGAGHVYKTEYHSHAVGARYAALIRRLAGRLQG